MQVIPTSDKHRCRDLIQYHRHDIMFPRQPLQQHANTEGEGLVPYDIMFPWQLFPPPGSCLLMYANTEGRPGTLSHACHSVGAQNKRVASLLGSSELLIQLHISSDISHVINTPSKMMWSLGTGLARHMNTCLYRVWLHHKLVEIQSIGVKDKLYGMLSNTAQLIFLQPTPFSQPTPQIFCQNQ